MAPTCGLCLAREKGWLLAWDERDWLYLLNHAGQPQGQKRLANLVGAACADDGSALAAAGQGAALWWLEPDLSLRWQRNVGSKPVCVAMDPFGQYVAVSEMSGTLHVFDCHGRVVSQTHSPRPFVHLAFIPAAAGLVGSADFGLVACLDLSGKWLWRDGLVVHVGSLTVTGGGEGIILACFTEGLHRYSLNGAKLPSISTVEPWRVVAVSFDGQRILVGGMSRRLYLLDSAGRTVRNLMLEEPPVALAIDPRGLTAFVALPDGRIIALDLKVTSS